MKYVGVDLHKKTISLCVVMQKAGQRVVVKRETLRCDQPQRISSWFRRLGTFQVTVEATSSYEWFVQLVEPLADRVVLMSQGEVIADGAPAEVLGASPLFAPQVARLFPNTGWLTAEDVLAADTNLV